MALVKNGKIVEMNNDSEGNVTDNTGKRSDDKEVISCENVHDFDEGATYHQQLVSNDRKTYQEKDKKMSASKKKIPVMKSINMSSKKPISTLHK